jgi:hypothetical protein
MLPSSTLFTVGSLPLKIVAMSKHSCLLLLIREEEITFNGIKRYLQWFSLSLILHQNKLQCSYYANSFQLILILVSKAGAYPSKTPCDAPFFKY